MQKQLVGTSPNFNDHAFVGAGALVSLLQVHGTKKFLYFWGVVLTSCLEEEHFIRCQ